jgi:hypothetical protein
MSTNTALQITPDIDVQSQCSCSAMSSTCVASSKATFVIRDGMDIHLSLHFMCSVIYSPFPLSGKVLEISKQFQGLEKVLNFVISLKKLPSYLIFLIQEPRTIVGFLENFLVRTVSNLLKKPDCSGLDFY